MAFQIKAGSRRSRVETDGVLCGFSAWVLINRLGGLGTRPEEMLD